MDQALWHSEEFFEKVNFEIKTADHNKRMKNYPVCKEITYISQASFLWAIGKQWRPRSDVHMSDQGLHSLLTEHSIKT